MPKNTGDETKSEIKLNRKMRMWNKYRNYFITGVVIVIVLIVLAIIFKGCSGKKKNDSKPTVTQQTTQADVTSNDSTNETTTQATTAAPAQTQPQTTQAAMYIKLKARLVRKILQLRIHMQTQLCSVILLQVVCPIMDTCQIHRLYQMII